MRGLKWFLTWATVAVLVLPTSVFAEAAENETGIQLTEAKLEEEYSASAMWMSETEGNVHLYDPEDQLLEPEEGMRFESGSVLETEEESAAVIDMDKERLAIMDEISRVAFQKTDHGDGISITLQNGAMYFRVGIPLEENESFDVNLGDIVLAIRGTCGMVQQNEGEDASIILASGHAAITRAVKEEEERTDENKTEDQTAENAEPEEITIEAGECVSVKQDESTGGLYFEKKKLTEEEVPMFLREALQKDPEQLEKVYDETGWQPEKLFADGAPAQGSDQEDEVMAYYRTIIREAERYDFFDFGERVTGYQYAIVYLDEDTVPTLLLAEKTDDLIRYFKLFHYDPEQHLTIESMTTISEYHQFFYLRSENRGLLQWYADGAYAYGIVEIYIENGDYKGKEVWYEENYDKAWPENLPCVEIVWTDVE